MLDFQTEVGEWANSVFIVATNKSIIAHLKREVVELAKGNMQEEASDCLLLLLHLAHRNGFDLYVSAKRKHEINKRRKWGKPDKEGVVEHIKRKCL